MYLAKDYTSEYAVIGSILIDARCLDSVLTVVGEADFDNLYCQAVMSAVIQLRNEGQTYSDPVLVMNRAKTIQPDINYEFAVECMNITATAANAAEYAKMVKEESTQRKLASLAEGILSGTENSASVISNLRRASDELATQDSRILTTEEAAGAWADYDDMVKRNPEVAFSRTGFKTLDNVLGGGMFNQGFYLIAARPGMGKTTLGIGIAENMAKQGSTVLFISLEMSRIQIMAKRISRSGRLSYTDLMTGMITGNEYAHLMSVQSELCKRPFFLSDTSLCRVSDVENMARSIPDLKCVVIDYFGLLTAEESSGAKSRYEEATETSKRLKSLAKRLNIPLLTLCQLNRETASRSDKRPTLSDLRDTGALEQDADAVILLHRPEYYEQKDESYIQPDIERIELIVAKNRHGRTSTINMAWEGRYGIINELETRRDDDNPFI